MEASAVMHRVGVVIGIIGLLGTWRLGRRVGGGIVGLVALVLLTLTPSWWGDMFNNPKDMPFAMGYVFAVGALVRWVRRFPRGSMREHAVLGVMLGLACCVRVGGLVLVAIFLAAIGVFAAVRATRTRRISAALELLAAQAPRAAVTVAIAWVVMIAAWPWAQLRPISRPILALSEMTRYTGHQRYMAFAGTDIHTSDPRPDYLLHYFGLKLPVLVLVLLAIAVAIALGQVARGRATRIHVRTYAILATAILLPPLYAIAAQSILYDGLRHFLFLVPLFAVIAAVGLVEATRLFFRPLPLVVGAGLLGAIWLAIGQVRDMIALHPNQYVYFNQIAGGLPGAFGRYDTDYYGNSYKEAYAKLFEHLWRTDRARFLNSDYVVSACMPELVAEHYLLPNARWSDGPGVGETPDFFIGYTRGGCHNKYPHTPVLLKVERQDTVLNVVRDLRRHPFREDPT